MKLRNTSECAKKVLGVSHRKSSLTGSVKYYQSSAEGQVKRTLREQKVKEGRGTPDDIKLRGWAGL